MRIQRSLPVIGISLLATAGLVLAQQQSDQQSDQADPVLQRLSSDFQNGGEASTIEPALPLGAGGMVTYQKTLTIPTDVNVIYVTFSAQGDVHNGTTLAMNASVNNVLIQPLLTFVGGGGNTVSGWYSLLKLPAAGANCNDGGGGPADCHDNTIYFSGCARVTPGATVTVRIKLADIPGHDANTAFYERSTINIDGLGDLTNSQCQPHSIP
jgi:hypothetical protein